MSDDLPRDWKNDPVDRPLIDDLADVLMHMVVGWKGQLGVDLAEHQDVQRVMRRYRASKSMMPVEELARRMALVIRDMVSDAARYLSQTSMSELNDVMYEAERRGWYR